jgi:hypothetical protein
VRKARSQFGNGDTVGQLVEGHDVAHCIAADAPAFGQSRKPIQLAAPKPSRRLQMAQRKCRCGAVIERDYARHHQRQGIPELRLGESPVEIRILLRFRNLRAIGRYRTKRARTLQRRFHHRAPFLQIGQIGQLTGTKGVE